MKDYLSLFKWVSLLFSIVVVFLMIQMTSSVGLDIQWWVIGIFSVLMIVKNVWQFSLKEWKSYDRIFGYAVTNFGLSIVYFAFILLYFLYADYSWKTDSSLIPGGWHWQCWLSFIPLLWGVFYGFWFRNKFPVR